ncbi:MFS transporter [Chromohalobacter israelensis]|uniref:MFS transporter n=1 Tax=Chromohalobacter israelensis TaxID=141390 RepID=UPI000D70C9CF|nr:MFS transporter [Chromohalobacter salexigens]PWW31503.1 GPH family glycoside/pentoside/hexuronide:cation symporter [Chromohalobacter salexigens]
MSASSQTSTVPGEHAASTASPATSAEKIGLLEKIGYGCGDLASNFIWQAMSIFIVYYYTDVIGVAAGIIGSIMLFSRVFDGVSDIAMGYVIDKTRSRHGKARPWLLWLAVPFALSAVMLFAVPDVSPFWQVVYIAVTYNVVCLVYTGLNVPYGTMNSLITQDQYQRSLLNVYRMSLALVGVLLVSNLTLPVATLLGGGQFGWVVTFMIFGSIGTALFIFTFKTTRERVKPASQRQRDSTVSLKESLLTLCKNRYWALATSFILMTYIFNALNSGAVVYYAEYILDDTWMVGIVTTAYIAFILVGMACVAPLTKRYGKRNAIIVGELITIFGYLVMLIDLSNVTLIIAGTIIRGIGKAPINGSMFAILGDTIEYGEWKTGIRNEGMVYSGGSMGIKIGSGLGTALIGWVLAFGGYVGGGGEQSATALLSIQTLFIYLPLALCVLLIVLMLFYDLDKRYPSIIEDLKARA